MSLVCEISGEPLSLFVGSSSYDSIVVTPSGHVCRKSLLLTKLTENGGKDPFENGRPLSEDELVELQQLRVSNTTGGSVSASTANQIAVPPRSSSSSVSHTLQQLQRDYDAVILELFDTRKLLTDTRKELSLALYENDAAVRVVARLAAERDQALVAVQTLETTSKVATNGVIREESESASEPPAKRNKTEALPAPNTTTTADATAVTDKMPPDDWNIMVAAWEKLHVNRKARQKAASKRAVSLEQVQTFVPTTLQSPPIKPSRGSKSSSQFTAALAYCANDDDTDTSSIPPMLVIGSRALPHVLVYTGKDNDDTIWSLRHTLKTSGVEGSGIDVRGSTVAVALVNGTVDIIARLEDEVSNVDTTNIAFISNKKRGKEAVAIVDVRLHPDGVHVVVATSHGLVLVARLDTVQVVACFGGATGASTPSSYSTGVLHPDGLIYVAADGVTGDLLLWDFKSQSLAESTLSGGKDHGVVTTLDCSNTGYHIGAAHKSGAVLIWDLRKQKILATLNTEEPNNDDDKASRIATVVAVKFDDAGKFIAYSGNGPNGSLMVCIVTIKDLSKTVTLNAPDFKAQGGLVWGKSSLAVSATPLTGKDNPQVVVFALP